MLRLAMNLAGLQIPHSKLRRTERRRGAIQAATLTMLIHTSHSTPITVTELHRKVSAVRVSEGHAAVPISTIRRVCQRLESTYVPGSDPNEEAWDPIAVVTEHDTETWEGDDGIVRCEGLVMLSPGGYQWAVAYITASRVDDKAAEATFNTALSGP